MRKTWEAENGKDWPVEENGKPYIAHHKNPLADGGDHSADNVEPIQEADHVQHHIDNGDTKRWGGRRYRPKLSEKSGSNAPSFDEQLDKAFEDGLIKGCEKSLEKFGGEDEE
jgi:hypothetical protein